jgi:hypothetical protein
MTIKVRSQHIFVRQFNADGTRHPAGCIYMVINHGTLTMGASLCAPSDYKPVKETGHPGFTKAKALENAEKKAFGTNIGARRNINIKLTPEVINDMTIGSFFSLISINKLFGGHLTKKVKLHTHGTDGKVYLYDFNRLISSINHQLHLMVEDYVADCTNNEPTPIIVNMVKEEDC